MTFSDPRSHSEPLLKSLRLLKFSDIIHLEILSFVYQWYYKLSRLLVLLIILTQCLQFVQIIHVNHRLIICLLSLFIPLNTAFILTVTLVQNFGILYLLMLRKSSRFPVFVNISRILLLMVIILLLIPNILRLYYLNYYLTNEVILFI